MLRATRRELTKAYRSHKPFCSDISIPTRRLLALYCIECGLKALIMKARRVDSSDELPDEAVIGHDLLAGLRLLGAPAPLFGFTQLRIRTTHKKDPQQDLHVKELHQALRYGIPVNLQTEASTEITKILVWLEGKIDE